jgi:hypothetical protein
VARESPFQGASKMSIFQLGYECNLMPKTKVQTERLQVTLALRTHALLAILANKGTYGTSPTDVAKSLIERGILEAKKDGLLTDDDIRTVQRPS